MMSTTTTTANLKDTEEHKVTKSENQEETTSTAVARGHKGTSDNASEKHLESLVKKKGPTFATIPPTLSKTLGPRRKSMYDHVEIDFVKSGKKTHLFRLVVAGTHEEDPIELMKITRSMIEEVNGKCQDECATGFLLAYPRQFIHVLEGSEDTLNHYLSSCADAFENTETVKGGESNPTKVRMLVLGYFSIEDRFLSRWLVAKFNPPRQVVNVQSGFRKNLFELVRTSLILAIIMNKQPAMKNGDIDWPDQTDASKIKRREQDLQLMQYLPSQQLILYIMKDKPRRLKLKSPSEFILKYWDVPDVILTKEIDWPIPCRIAPYD